MSQLPPEFDDYQPSQYDPQFTADISMLMHVPDRIEVAGEDDTDSLRQRAMMPEHMAIKNMVVPDKIIMLGQDRSAGVHDEPNLHLDFGSLPGESSYVNLATPPRVLTLDERSFPTVDDMESYAMNRQVASNDFEPKTNGHLFGAPRVVAHDIVSVQRHLAVLSEHVKRLETENARRWQRELMLYPLLLGYVMLKVARWLVLSK
jgi:hypothetical protein